MKNNNLGTKKIGDVVDFVAKAAKEGRIATTSGQSVRAACVKVFSVIYGENWGNVRVDEVILEDVLGRYGEMERGKRSNETIRTNKSKTRRAFRLAGLIEEAPESSASKKTAAKVKAETEYEDYVISLTGGRAARLSIPRDLDKAELAEVERAVKNIFMAEGFKRKGG